MAYRVKEAEFKAIAERELKSLPERFGGRMENLVVVVEDYPSEEDAESTGVPRDELLGLFHGVSRFGQEWCGGAPGQLPERIVLYKRNIEDASSTRDELIEEIRLTLLHEIGHYFGLGEEDMED